MYVRNGASSDVYGPAGVRGPIPPGLGFDPVTATATATAAWEAGSSLWDSIFGGGWPKPLSEFPPLPYSAPEVAGMMRQNKYIADQIRTVVRGQGHGHLYPPFGGRQPTEADYQDVGTLAGLALWFANGTGDDMSRGEAEIRSLILQGMASYDPSPLERARATVEETVQQHPRESMGAGVAIAGGLVTLMLLAGTRTRRG